MRRTSAYVSMTRDEAQRSIRTFYEAVRGSLMEEGLRSENSRVVRAAGIVGTATMLSRVFGAGFATDAFFVAFRIPNLLRRLLAEGSLTVSFVPVFTEYLRNKTRKE